MKRPNNTNLFNDSRKHVHASRPYILLAARCINRALLCLSLMLFGMAHAATLTVDSTGDSAVTAVSDGQCTLREAIGSLNVGSAEPDCPVPEGQFFGTDDKIVFDPSINGNPIKLDGAQIIIYASMTIEGNGGFNTVINGRSKSRIFYIASSAGDVKLQGLLITQGATHSDNEPGGAIQSFASLLTINNSRFVGNRTAGAYSNGGAIHSVGLLSINHSLLLANSTNGGADGGAVSAKTVTMSHSTLSNNNADSALGRGGALHVNDHATLLSSTLNNNSAVWAGGAIFVDYYASLNVINSTLSGNVTKGQGGAIYTWGSDVSLTNSTVAFNRSISGAGGGIGAWVRRVPEIAMRLYNSILANNQSKEAGADFAYAAIHATPFGPRRGAPPPPPRSKVIAFHSIVGSSEGSDGDLSESPANGTPDANGNFIGGPTNGLFDPHIAPLANNGGRTQTHALCIAPGNPHFFCNAASLALDTGDDNLAKEDNINPLIYDQRGAPFDRKRGPVDIGAYESGTRAVFFAPPGGGFGVPLLPRGQTVRIVDAVRITEPLGEDLELTLEFAETSMGDSNDFDSFPTHIVIPAGELSTDLVFETASLLGEVEQPQVLNGDETLSFILANSPDYLKAAPFIMEAMLVQNSRGCPEKPLPSCMPSQKKAKLSANDQKVKFAWASSAFNPGMFGKPADSTDISLCLFRDSSLAGGWRAVHGEPWLMSEDGHGLKYANKDNAEGLVKFNGKTSDKRNKSKIVVTTDSGVTLPLDVAQDAGAQVVTSNGDCWTAGFSGEQILEDSGKQFKAKK